MWFQLCDSVERLLCGSGCGVLSVIEFCCLRRKLKYGFFDDEKWGRWMYEEEDEFLLKMLGFKKRMNVWRRGWVFLRGRNEEEEELKD